MIHNTFYNYVTIFAFKYNIICIMKYHSITEKIKKRWQFFCIVIIHLIYYVFKVTSNSCWVKSPLTGKSGKNKASTKGTLFHLGLSGIETSFSNCSCDFPLWSRAEALDLLLTKSGFVSCKNWKRHLVNCTLIQCKSYKN